MARRMCTTQPPQASTLGTDHITDLWGDFTMHFRMPAALGIAGLLALLAGCSSPAPPPQPTRPAVPQAASKAQPPARKLPHGVSVAPQSGGTPPGPFIIRPTYCGPFSSARRQRLGTTAHGGLVYRFANESQSVTGAPSLRVNFLRGTSVVASNVSGGSGPIAPGQSAVAEVDAVGGSGQPVAFRGCQLISYALVTAGGDQPGTYAP